MGGGSGGPGWVVVVGWVVRWVMVAVVGEVGDQAAMVVVVGEVGDQAAMVVVGQGG